MVLLKEYPTLDEAMIVSGMLGAYGVESHVNQDAVSSVFPAPGAGTESASIYVDESEYEKALMLLSEHND